MLPMITEPSLADVRLSGKIRSPGMVIVSGVVAAAAGHALTANGTAPSEASNRCRKDDVMFVVLSVRVGNTVDRVVPVLAHQQRAVAGHHGADRSRPGVAVVGDEPDEKVVVLAGRHAVLHAHTHDLMTRAECAVPRAVHHREAVADILLRKDGAARGGG